LRLKGAASSGINAHTGRSRTVRNDSKLPIGASVSRGCRRAVRRGTS
jgi:hypothetical protein